MAHGDAREGKWRGNWRMQWVASTLHTTSEHGVSSITTTDVHTSVASSRLNWSPRRFKWTRPFRRKTKSGFCACAITFQTQSTFWYTTTDTLTFLFYSRSQAVRWRLSQPAQWRWQHGLQQKKIHFFTLCDLHFSVNSYVLQSVWVSCTTLYFWTHTTKNCIYLCVILGFRCEVKEIFIVRRHYVG